VAFICVGGKLMNLIVKQVVILLLFVLSAYSNVSFAQNQDTPSTAPTAPDEPVKATGVGIAGGIIAGAEVVLLTESIFDVKPRWPWWVFSIAGAAGGGVGGYFLEKNSSKGAVALLVTSMAAIIPTVVAVSVARAYEPEDEGAVDGNGQDDIFEQKVNATVDSGPSEAVTEVEAKPEGIPEGSAPPAVGPEAPPAENQPAEQPSSESAPADGAGSAPAKDEGTSLIDKKESIRLAHLQSGALFHFDRSMNFGFGIPEFDVSRTIIESPYIYKDAARGVQLQVSLFKVDLP
jgi:hypothetical protein